MTLEEQLNAVVRLAVYWSVAVTLIKKNVRYMLPAVLVCAATVVIHEVVRSRGADALTEKYAGVPVAPCRMPTVDNPHMNVMMGDYLNLPEGSPIVANRPAACDVTDPLVQRVVDASVPSLPQDDPFADGRTDRQFYTMPSTTIPNDQKGYREFLYGDVMKPTLKVTHGF